MKRIIWILIILAMLVGGGYFIWKWYFQKQESIDAFKLIPKDAVFIVETDAPVDAWKTFSKSDLWQHEKKFKALGNIGKMADVLSNTIEDNDLIFSAFGKRTVLISAHVTNATDYDFLYVCDMKQGAKFSTVTDGILKLLKNNGYSYSSDKLDELEIHKFYDPKDKSTLHLVFIANQLVCSYDAGIIRASIKASKTGEFANNLQFKTIAEKTASGGLCKIYLNHNQVPAFLDVYMDDVSGLKSIFQGMYFTGAKAEMNDNLVKFTGFTNINDSMGTHLRALMRSGSSNTRAQEVLSAKTAFFMSMGFQSFGKFYENLKEVYKEDAKSWADFEKNKKLVEGLLRISVEDDILGWIDDEVAVAQYEQDRVIGGKVNTVVAMKAESEEKALDKLGKLERRLKIIGKFKTEKYKEHDIHYMEIRGLFKLFFGKLFDKIQKPYYTILNNYVVFCDDAATLLKTIDDFDAGNTLAKNEKFSAFYEGFKKDNSVFMYVNMKKYFLNLKGILDAPSYASSYGNREYIISFPQMGFQMAEDDGIFDTRLLVEFKVPDEYDLEITEGKVLSREDFEEGDSMSEADAFILEYINGNVKKEFYDNGKPKIIAEMKDGELDGKYLEYYETGTIKIKGRYKNGVKKGRWFYYNEAGDLDHQEKFGRKSEDTDATKSEPDIVR